MLKDLESVKIRNAQGFIDSSNPFTVILVNSAGDILKVSLQEENRLGAEASGSDGATSRVITLQNTSESGNPTSVWVEDQLINQADITFNHLSSSSTLIFDNINLFNTDNIRVRYYIWIKN